MQQEHWAPNRPIVGWFTWPVLCPACRFPPFVERADVDLHLGPLAEQTRGEELAPDDPLLAGRCLTKVHVKGIVARHTRVDPARSHIAAPWPSSRPVPDHGLARIYQSIPCIGALDLR